MGTMAVIVAEHVGQAGTRKRLVASVREQLDGAGRVAADAQPGTKVGGGLLPQGESPLASTLANHPHSTEY
jgi:hypothetical protein